MFIAMLDTIGIVLFTILSTTVSKQSLFYLETYQNHLKVLANFSTSSRVTFEQLEEVFCYHWNRLLQSRERNFDDQTQTAKSQSQNLYVGTNYEHCIFSVHCVLSHRLFIIFLAQTESKHKIVRTVRRVNPS